jgi:predicted unusual protein kinase regulating ubiquinone biosynthesis (AarF/ABC1/UbiB family)
MRASTKVAGAATMAAAVALACRARTSRRTTPPTSTAGRIGTVALAAGRATATAVVHHGRATFTGTEPDVTLRERWQVETTDQVAASLGDLRGALMKVGQMASYVDQGFPEPVRRRLAQLQDEAPMMAPALASSIVEEELGAPPDRVFATWDPEPFAAASIGQVHRAITHEGDAVAVKVQYPDIAATIGSDLVAAAVLFAGLRSRFGGLDGDAIVEELRSRVVEECDYELEAARQQRFADHYAGHPHIHVPQVHADLSTGRVLTTELVVGARFREVESWPQAERDLAGETIYRFVFTGLYELHAFHGDPHPGNFLFHGDGRVTFLDFGLVKELAVADVDRFGAMTRAMVVDRDPAAFRTEAEAAGYLAPGLGVSDEEVCDYFRHFYEFIAHDEPFTMTPEFASATVRRFFDPSGAQVDIVRSSNVPPATVILQRINLGLHGVLAELGATANWRRVAEQVWPWSRTDPADPLGRAHAAWRDGREAPLVG